MKITSSLIALKKSELVRGSIIVIGGNTVANFVAYLYHVFVGRILGPVGYGELAALLSLLYIITVPSEVIRMTSTKYYSVFFAKGQLGQAKSLYLKFTKYIIFIAVIGLFVSYPFFGYIGRFLNISNTTNFLFLYVMFAFQLQNSLNIGSLTGFQKFLDSTIYLNIALFARLVLGILSAFYGVAAAVAGNALSTVAGVLIYIFPLRFILKSPGDQVQVSKNHVLQFGGPTLLATLGLTALYSMDVVLVKHFFPAYEAGIYSSLAVLGKIIFFASNSFGMILFPIIARKWELGQPVDSDFRLALAAVILISAVITAVYFLFPYTVVNLLFGAGFLPAVQYVGVFGIFLSLFSISSLVMNAYLAIGKTIVWIFMVSAAILQSAGISMFHGSLQQVIYVNIAVCALLCVSVLSYYPYAKKRIS